MISSGSTPRPSDAAIEVEQLRCVFGTHTAVDGIDFSVPPGQVLGLLGPNGAGKTTTVRMLATLTAPTSGHARVFGYDVLTQAHQVRSLIGLTGQYASVDSEMTARENLSILARLNGLSGKAAKARSSELLEEFDLTAAAGRAVSTYSGGMRRRLDLAASLISRPPLIFLDEPTTGLDPRSRMQMWQTVRQLVAQGSTVLLTTQYLEEADYLAHRIVVIDHGKVVASGTPLELKGKVAAASLRVLGVRFEERERIAAIVARIISTDGQTPAIDSHSGAVTIPVADPSPIAAVMQALNDEGIAVAEIGVSPPSLDEVFLALTGHGTGEAA